MDIRTRKENNTTFIVLSGQIDDDGAYEIESIIDEDCQNGTDKFVFDLSNLESLSNAGLRVMFLAQKRTHGNTIIKNASSHIKEAFEIAGFDSYFIFE